MADKNTSPGVFANENLSSEFLGRDINAFKKIEIRNKINQSLPTLILPKKVNQGSIDIRFPEPPEEKDSVILKKLISTRTKEGLLPQPVSKVPAKVSPIKITPFSIFFHTSTTLVRLFGVFEHDSTTQIKPFTVFQHSSSIVIESFGVFRHTSSIIVKPFGIFEHNSNTITVPLEIQEHYSTVGDRVPYSLDFLSSITIPSLRTAFRTTISLADRLNQITLGTTRHLPQFFLSDVFADYIKVIPFGVYEHLSPLGLLVFDFTPTQGGLNQTPFDFIPSQGGLFPNPFNFDVNSAQGIYVGSAGSLVSSIIVNAPLEQILPLQGVVAQGDQFVSLIDPETPILDIILRQGVVSINNELFSVISTNTPIGPEGLPKDGIDPIQPPSPSTNTQAQLSFATTVDQNAFFATINGREQEKVDSSQEPQVLGYSLDRLLAATLPRVKHGSATLPTTTFNTDITPQQGGTTLTNVEYEADKAQSEQEPIKRHGPANALPGPAFEPDNVLSTKVNPLTGLPQIDGEGETSNITLPDPIQGNPNSTQPQQLAASNTFSNTGGDLTKYKTLSYGEIVEIASSGRHKEEAPQVFSAAVDSPGSGDFVTVEINDITFRAYITSFNESYSPSWNDIRYVGRQDVLKQFQGVTRAGSLGFKVAAFSRDDLKKMYIKLNRLATSTCIGTGGQYLTAPITYLTVGNWFVNTPCVTTGLKFDIAAAEEPWDVGQAGVEDDDNPQMPKIVTVGLDFTILGNNGGGPLSGNSTLINYAAMAAIP